jgi:DNA-binding NtrC family response regulator
VTILTENHISESIKPLILVIDDDEGLRDSLWEILEDDYEVVCVESGFKAIDKIKEQVFDLVLLDILMPDMDGIQTLKRIRELDKDLDVIMISAIDRAQQAIDSIQLGAYDYITKPFEHELILNRVERVLQTRTLAKRVDFHKAEEAFNARRFKIITQSKKMDAVFETVIQVAKTSSNVLITGESGTGKELIAKAIHHKSPRKEKQFVAINCAAIPGELMEAELFGHEKGAFTSAHQQNIGKFEFAHQGTILLDEISCLKPELQAKLLRFIQEREFTKIGSHRSIKVDIRIIAATNTSLDKLVKQGKFREDLYFRLNVVPILLPPLRERKGDVPLLADHFLDKFNQKTGKNIKGLTEAAIAVLDSYLWPGNIRELRNMIERLVVMTKEEKMIEENDLPFDLLLDSDIITGFEMNDQANKGLIPARNYFERLFIKRALQNCRWNQTWTADHLGIHRNTLLQKMKAHNLTRGLAN